MSKSIPASEYTKWDKYIDDTPNVIPMSVIEDIKAEIEKQDFTHHEGLNHWYMTPSEMKDVIFEIIDKHISGKENEC